jgi:hypothetical protein
MANVLRTPKSKDTFEDSSAEEHSPLNLSKISSADQKLERSNEEIGIHTKPFLTLFHIFNLEDLRPVI